MDEDIRDIYDNNVSHIEYKNMYIKYVYSDMIERRRGVIFFKQIADVRCIFGSVSSQSYLITQSLNLILV